MIWIEERLYQALGWVVFELNDAHRHQQWFATASAVDEHQPSERTRDLRLGHVYLAVGHLGLRDRAGRKPSPLRFAHHMGGQNGEVANTRPAVEDGTKAWAPPGRVGPGRTTRAPAPGARSGDRSPRRSPGDSSGTRTRACPPDARPGSGHRCPGSRRYPRAARRGGRPTPAGRAAVPDGSALSELYAATDFRVLGAVNAHAPA
jgi:hypothetical protein